MKINVKVNEKSWKFYLSKPDEIIKKKVKLLNKNIKFFSKKNLSQLLFYLIQKKSKHWIVNLEEKTKVQIYSLFHLMKSPQKKYLKEIKKFI